MVAPVDACLKYFCLLDTTGKVHHCSVFSPFVVDDTIKVIRSSGLGVKSQSEVSFPKCTAIYDLTSLITFANTNTSYHSRFMGYIYTRVHALTHTHIHTTRLVFLLQQMLQLLCFKYSSPILWCLLNIFRKYVVFC